MHLIKSNRIMGCELAKLKESLIFNFFFIICRIIFEICSESIILLNLFFPL